MHPLTVNQKKNLLKIASVILMGIVFASFLTPGYDLVNYFTKLPQDYLQGRTRFYDDGAPDFPYFPWFLLLMFPLAWIPLQLAQLVLFSLSIGSVMIAVDVFAHSRAAQDFLLIFFLIANLHFIYLLYLGQVDGIMLIALTLGYLAARREKPGELAATLFLMGMKPINLVLAAALYVYHAFQHWRRQQFVIAVVLPAFSLLALSVLISGPDWVVRYIDRFGNGDKPGIMQVSLWDLGLPPGLVAIPAIGLLLLLAQAVKTQGLSHWTLSLALVINALLSPHTKSYHFVLLYPAFIYLWLCSRRAAVAVWLITFTPLLRTGGERFDLGIIDIMYPLGLLAGLFLYRKPGVKSID